MSWGLYYLVIGVVAVIAFAAFAVRSWYRGAMARQAAQDEAALASYRFGAKHRIAALSEKYDQSKAATTHKRDEAAAAWRRAKSAKVVAAVMAKPVKVTQMRRAK